MRRDLNGGRPELTPLPVGWREPRLYCLSFQRINRPGHGHVPPGSKIRRYLPVRPDARSLGPMSPIPGRRRHGQSCSASCCLSAGRCLALAELLTFLRDEGVPHGIATSGRRPEIDAPLEALGVPPDMAVVSDRAAGAAGMTLVERPEPPAAITSHRSDHASGFVPTEVGWPSTWTDRAGRDRRPSILGHELAGVVTSLGYGTTGLSVGQRVFGLADWHRDGTLALGLRRSVGLAPSGMLVTPPRHGSATPPLVPSNPRAVGTIALGSAIAARRPDGIAGTQGAPVSATQAIARGAEARSRWLPFHANSAHGRPPARGARRLLQSINKGVAPLRQSGRNRSFRIGSPAPPPSNSIRSRDPSLLAWPSPRRSRRGRQVTLTASGTSQPAPHGGCFPAARPVFGHFGTWS